MAHKSKKPKELTYDEHSKTVTHKLQVLLQNIKPSKLLDRIPLPSPKDLGWTQYNGLQLRSFAPFTTEKTWEDWHAYCEEHFPTKYFLANQLGRKVARIEQKIENAWYWLKCHTLPQYKFHMLDLRGVDPLSEYTYGYRDPYGIMELSAWAALRIYVEQHLWPEDRVIKDVNPDDEETLQAQIKAHNEVITLYDWWMRGRGIEEEAHNLLYEKAKAAGGEAIAAGDKDAYDQSHDEWLADGRRMDQKKEEMFNRLVAVRRYLWN